MTLARWILLGIVLVGVLALGLGIAALGWLQGPHGGATGPVLVEIEPGSSARGVAEELEQAEVVGPAWVFARLLQASGVHREIRAGVYELERPLSPLAVMRQLREGRVATLRVTIPEGLDRYETAAVIAAAGLSSEPELVQAFGDPAPIADLDPRAETLEGYLFPDTYRFAHAVDAAEIAAELVATFRERFAAGHLGEVARSELTLREVVTLASLVEKETGVPHERARIAGVFHERLDRGMLLQCDPTVIYALKQEGTWDGNIRRRDLALDHPYNTYVHSGLPPGPIASPGLDALVAVLEPKREGALYFVARGDGSHYFSSSLREHINAVRRYQLRRR
jgi:UPF0755 protein